MMPSIIHVLEVSPQPWRNGGGSTRELLALPSAQAWQVRISLADIDQDGAFSAYAGVQRWFAVVQGAGVELDFAGRQVVQTIAAPALQFDGAHAPGCRLLGGATQDVNLMVRGPDAGCGQMQPVVAGEPYASVMPLRALFTTVAGVWSDGLTRMPLAPYDFLWSDTAGAAAWRFWPDSPPAASKVGAWWLAAHRAKEAA